MFRAVYTATFITLLGLFFNLREKTVRKWWVYVLVFLAIIFSNLAIDYLFASEDFKFYIMARERYLTSKEKKSQPKTKREVYEEFRKSCIEQAHYHRDEAQQCYAEFERICNTFPNIDDGKKALMCLNSAFAAAMPAQPAYRILAAVIFSLQQISNDLYVQWQQLDAALHEAKYHVEAYEHYKATEKYVRGLRDLEPLGSTGVFITD